MAHIITLTHGLKVGEDILREVELRQLTAGDVLDAQEAAEKVVVLPSGDAALVPSPSRMGMETTRRQIARIGDMSGPLSLQDMRRLHPEDLSAILVAAEALDDAAAAKAVGQEASQRGRDAAVGGSAAAAHPGAGG